LENDDRVNQNAIMINEAKLQELLENHADRIEELQSYCRGLERRIEKLENQSATRHKQLEFVASKNAESSVRLAVLERFVLGGCGGKTQKKTKKREVEGPTL